MGYCPGTIHEIFEHARLADEKLAARVLGLLETETIDDREAYMAWLMIAFCGKRYSQQDTETFVIL